MPCQKELHYFDRGMRYESARKRLYSKLCRTDSSRADAGQNAGLSENSNNSSAGRSIQIRFLADYLLGPGSDRRLRIENKIQAARNDAGVVTENPGLIPDDFELYKALFQHHSKPVCGEITPAYCFFSTQYIELLNSHFPDTNYILLVRDPVERQFSRALKMLARGILQIDDLIADMEADVGKSAIGPDAVIDPCQIYDRWVSVVGRSKVLLIEFSEIVDAPANVQAKLADFLRLPGSVNGYTIEPGFNRKRKAGRSDVITDDQYELLERLITERHAEAREKYRIKFRSN